MTIERSQDTVAFHDFEHDGWETNSEGYERHWARLTRQAVPATLDAANVKKGVRLLDVCTGPGLLASVAVDRGADVAGLDFSARVVEIAQRNVPGAVFEEGDAQNLPFDDETFDAVVCGYGIVHLAEPELALTEMRRVLKKNGRFATTVWEIPKPDNGFGIVFGALKAHGSLDVPLPHGPNFFQFSEPEAFKAALKSTGFLSETVEPVEQFWDLEAPQGLMAAIMEGAVRARGILNLQSDEARKAINNAVSEGMEKFRSPEGPYVVPMPAWVGAGAR